MKKSLLLAAGFAMAFAASAQQQVVFTNSEALGFDGKPTLTAGTLLAETEDVTMTFLNDDEVSAQNPDFNGFKYVVVDGVYTQIVQGLGGTTNGAATLSGGPTAGCIYNFEVKKNGWLIVVSKISSNKNFYAFEGKIGEGPMPVAYTLGMDIQSTDYPDIDMVLFTLPGDDLGYVDIAAAGEYTFGADAIAWPIRIGTGNPDAASAGNGTGVIMFKVWEEAANYMVLATGSKMNTCGAIFVPCDDPDSYTPAVSIYAPARTVDEQPVAEMWRVFTGEQPAAPGEEGALADIIADADAANAPMFNVLGQQVDASYKGLVIKNGQKFINR